MHGGAFVHSIDLVGWVGGWGSGRKATGGLFSSAAGSGVGSSIEAEIKRNVCTPILQLLLAFWRRVHDYEDRAGTGGWSV